MRDLVLPLEFCRDVSVYGGSELALKVVLAALDRLRATHAEEPIMEGMSGGHVVRVPVADVVAMTQGKTGTGTTAGVIRRARETLVDVVREDGTVRQGMRAQWSLGGAFCPQVPLVEDVGGGQRHAGGPSMLVELTMAVADVFFDGPDLRVPMADLRGVTTRCGVLLLLRGYAALAERREPKAVREQLYSAACQHYTGQREGAGGRPASLRDAVEDHLMRAAAEVNATSTGLRVTVAPKLVKGGRGEGARATRYEHVDLTFDHVRATRRCRVEVEQAA